MVAKLGEMLVAKGIITGRQLETALSEQQKKKGELLGATLIRLGYLKEEQLLVVLSEQLSIPYVKLGNIPVSSSAIDKVPAKFAWHYRVVPIRYKGGKLTIAAFDPLRSLNDLKMFLGYEIDPVLASEAEIIKAIRKYYGVGAETVQGIIAKAPRQSVEAKPAEKVEDITKLAEDASIVKLVNQIILEAHRKRATDIHIEPYRGKLGLRYRIDGVLYEADVSPEMKRLFSAIISRIKIMSKLNIVERRLPQDGRAVVKIGEDELDLRISVIPTRHGEGMVIRILPARMLFSLKKLGLEQKNLNTIEELIKKPHGIIFISGPTGSGKTTTLYACLSSIKSTKNKIITIEDPIEYELEGISQIQVMSEIGFTFAQGLRSMLRHDPDIMMVGEVRDLETAELAIRIALTGHLVFSTVHTNDAAGGITRLLNIGIEPFLVASSVEAFIAQRLIRLICPKCKQEDEASSEIKRQIIKDVSAVNPGLKESDIHFYRGRGCEECNFTGFKERTAIYEILVVNKEIKELILEKSSTDKINERVISQGMKTLRVSGWEKVIAGLTTPQEIIRVTQAEEE
ncbi:MAG: GspE/PulE family protein [Candidatus Omnitrophota bacterium]|nr:GspE/PulE family protein [Candidatus Omnitrophota bacterium]